MVNLHASFRHELQGPWTCSPKAIWISTSGFPFAKSTEVDWSGITKRIFNKSSQHLYLLVSEECLSSRWVGGVLHMFLDSSSIGASILKLPKELWLLASRLRATADRPRGWLCQVMPRTNKRWQTIQIINFCAGRPSGCHGSTALWAELPACPMKS